MYHELKCFRANKKIDRSKHLPLILINVNQTTPGSAFTEYFILTALEGRPFLHRSTGYTTGRNVSAPEFDEAITKEGLFATELEAAKAHFESAVFETNRTMHEGYFCTGGKVTFDEINTSELLYWLLRHDLKGHFKNMFDMTESSSMDCVKKLWKAASRIVVESDPA